MIARTPQPPYWAVIFTSRRNADDDEGYARMAEAMAALAAAQPGCLGFESARGADGEGITVSYWDSEQALRGWKLVSAHLTAQRLGRERWYAEYVTRIARVEREYTLETSPCDGL